MRKGAYYTNEYRNLFSELGIDEKDVDAKVQDTWDRLFTDQYPETQIYFETDDDMGYMVDTGNNDVRTEGQSYGMMMAVQMDRQDIFDRIWKWTKNICTWKKGFMQATSLGHVNLMEQKCTWTRADGEEYFAMALYFASKRWGIVKRHLIIRNRQHLY